MPKNHLLLIAGIITVLNVSACQATKPIVQHFSPIVNPDEDMDSDNDGVPDSKDQCPNSRFDTIIDEKGCPIMNRIIEEREPPTVRLFFPKNQNYPYDNNQLLTQNSDIIRQTMFKSLGELSAYTKLHPEKSLCLLIEGHASKGKYGDTVKDIDLQRALTVKQMYKEWLGFKEKNIKLEHFNADRPIAPNDTPEHTLMNQRVYITQYICQK